MTTTTITLKQAHVLRQILQQREELLRRNERSGFKGSGGYSFKAFTILAAGMNTREVSAALRALASNGIISTEPGKRAKWYMISASQADAALALLETMSSDRATTTIERIAEFAQRDPRGFAAALVNVCDTYADHEMMRSEPQAVRERMLLALLDSHDQMEEK